MRAWRHSWALYRAASRPPVMRVMVTDHAAQRFAERVDPTPPKAPAYMVRHGLLRTNTRAVRRACGTHADGRAWVTIPRSPDSWPWGFKALVDRRPSGLVVVVTVMATKDSRGVIRPMKPRVAAEEEKAA